MNLANWKPMTFGLIAGICGILTQEGIGILPLGKTTLVGLIGSISVFLLGFFAKDSATTGGTVPVTKEAAVRVEQGTKALDPVAVSKVAEKIDHP
jgi:hypothetical protein